MMEFKLDTHERKVKEARQVMRWMKVHIGVGLVLLLIYLVALFGPLMTKDPEWQAVGRGVALMTLLRIFDRALSRKSKLGTFLP